MGRLHYAGRAGTGMTDKELKRLAGVLAPLQVPKMPLAEPPPRDSRFGSPLKLLQGALGEARAGRGSDVPDLDRRQPVRQVVVSGAAGGQAGKAGHPTRRAGVEFGRRASHRSSESIGFVASKVDSASLLVRFTGCGSAHPK